MFTLGAPVYLAVAALAASGVVALHLLAWRRPRPTPLPTARFVPDAPLRAVSRDLRLTDLALLLLRAFSILAAGLALSNPRLTTTPTGRARVIVADRSRAVASERELRDSVRALATGVDLVRLVWFDSTAGTATGPSDSTVLARSGRRGSLSVGLLAGMREARRLSRDFAGVEMALVSPVAREEVDAASSDVRRLWTGELRLVRVSARTATAPAATTPVVPPIRDPIGAATRLALSGSGRTLSVRVTRGVPSSDDSAAARAGALLVVWPDSSSAGLREPARAAGSPGGAGIVGEPDTRLARAVITSGHAVIAPLLQSAEHPTGTAVARWDDGSVAAGETSTGEGCIRRVGFLPPAAGDLVLRPSFTTLVGDLLVPCGAPDWRPIPSGELAWLVSSGSAASVAGASSGAVARAVVDSSQAGDDAPPIAERWLIALAFAALLAEWLLRRRTSAAAPAAASSPRVREAA